MRTLLFTNGELGTRVARWLHDRGDLLGVVLHAPDAQRDTGSIRSLPVPVWPWPVEVEDVRDREPECVLSVLFGHVLAAPWLELPSWAAVNLHPGLLPYNAGANPNVWPLVDGTPAGTTLHLMTAQIDAGAVLAQREVPTRPDDTGATLYRRLMDASFGLFVEVWPTVREVVPVPQREGGTYHRSAELASLDPTPAEIGLVDRLRARTFPPFGAEFEREGRRWRVQVTITEVDR